MAVKISHQEVLSFVKQVDELKAQGMSASQACEKLKSNASRYYNFKKRIADSVPSEGPQIIIHPGSDIALPVTKIQSSKRLKTPLTGKCIIMMAEISSVADLLREFI